MSNSIISGRDFIVFGLQPWDFEMGSNCKNIATEFAKSNRVLYVNRPIERSSLFKFNKDHKIQNRLKSLKDGVGVLEMSEDNIWVFNPRVILESINWLPSQKLYHSISKINARRLANQINWAIQQLGFKNPILFIDNDFLKGFYLNDYLNTDLVVYYIRDFLLSQPYFVKHGRKLEPAFMAKADVVVANSSYLANYSKQFNTESFDIGQGCELNGYLATHHDVPNDIKGIKQPIIGYSGALLETRLDIKLLEEMAQRKKDWSIVLVGPEDKAFQESALHRMENVYFLGSKPVEQLPAYVHQFDICINPQVLNQMTIGNYPRKIDEYLAAGKRVVATKTQAMQLFKDFCFLATNTNEYISGITQLLETIQSEDEINKRKAFAQSHTWESSVDELYRAIMTYQKKKAYAAA